VEHQINHAEIIRPQKNNTTVQLGHTVTIESGDTIKIFRILGSAETDPKKGIISQNSPIGAAVIGRKLGDVVKIHLAGKDVEYVIKKIE
jgi:transcription elongation factor GreA